MKQCLVEYLKLHHFAAASLMLATTAIGGAVSAGEVDAWQKSVVQKISKEHIYPRSAIQKELEGVAKVQITIDRSGAITDYKIVEPTGESALDSAIPKMMEKINPIPTPPSSLADNNLTFVLPIAWRLN